MTNWMGNLLLKDIRPTEVKRVGRAKQTRPTKHLDGLFCSAGISVTIQGAASKSRSTIPGWIKWRKMSFDKTDDGDLPLLGYLHGPYEQTRDSNLGELCVPLKTELDGERNWRIKWMWEFLLKIHIMRSTIAQSSWHRLSAKFLCREIEDTQPQSEWALLISCGTRTFGK